MRAYSFAAWLQLPPVQKTATSCQPISPVLHPVSGGTFRLHCTMPCLSLLAGQHIITRRPHKTATPDGRSGFKTNKFLHRSCQHSGSVLICNSLFHSWRSLFTHNIVTRSYLVPPADFNSNTGCLRQPMTRSEYFVTLPLHTSKWNKLLSNKVLTLPSTRSRKLPVISASKFRS